MDMRELVKDLEARRALVQKMGGEDKVKKQHDRGKMTARERLTAFFDDGVFFEVGLHGTQMGLGRQPAGFRSGRLWCCITGDGKLFTPNGKYAHIE